MVKINSKKIIIILLILINTIQTIFSLSEFEEKKLYLLDIIDDTTLQKVFEVKKTKDEIYKIIENWIPSNFRDEKSKIIKSDKENYTIEGIGNLVLSYPAMFDNQTYNTFFNYKFEIKDNKFRFTILNPYFEIMNFGNLMSGIQYISKDSFYTLKEMSTSIYKINLISQLIKTINGEEEKKDNW